MQDLLKKSSLIINIFLILIILFFFCIIFFINFSINPSFYSGDMYEDIMLSMEIWESKSIIPSGWVFFSSNKFVIVLSITISNLLGVILAKIIPIKSHTIYGEINLIMRKQHI